MATKPAFKHWTYEEVAQLPEDGNRYEIVAGELIVTPPSPKLDHQELIGRLYVLLRPFVRAHGLGRVILSPFDVLLAKGDYLIPDLVFVRNDRIAVVTQRGVEGAPDLAVEVLSPSTAFRDRGIKRDRYAHFGVAEYWVLDPRERRFEAYRLAEDPARATVLTSGTYAWQPVPGGPVLEIDVAELFQELG